MNRVAADLAGGNKHMSDVWRIFVVEGDENLNLNMVNTLRKDGYVVQGVLNGADAVRVLWTEEYDVVLCDLKTPGADGFELLEWLRAYRPGTRVILIGGTDSTLRMQALESGAASYVEKPVDLHLLKEELRRLLQQTGFSANLDSFDLLDVIQIINISRKTITLLINTGLEERGTLRFKDGELVWAEYGVLRGEEAFFALAAHKNGTVIHQPWNGHITSNVTQPLSRLIFQALQYRSKYARQFTGEQAPVTSSPLFSTDEYDDSPFVFVEEPGAAQAEAPALDVQMPVALPTPQVQEEEEEEDRLVQEWWERTGSIPALGERLEQQSGAEAEVNSTLTIPREALQQGTITPSIAHKTPVAQRADLPSWLTDQPTASQRVLERVEKSPSQPALPVTPVIKTSSPEWQDAQDFPPVAPATFEPLEENGKLDGENNGRPVASSEWQAPVGRDTATFIPPARPAPGVSETTSMRPVQGSTPSRPLTGAQRSIRRRYNYSALVAGLQSLGYALPGFIASAVVNLEGQPIAQVAVEEVEISRLSKFFSMVMGEGNDIFADEVWGGCGDVLINSVKRQTLLRLLGEERNVFLVLIVARDTDLVAYRDMIGTIEYALNAALRQ